jgi:hypothetical protein
VQSLGGGSQRARDIAGGTFDRSDVVLGSANELILKRVAGPQIASVYGTEFRSTPVFFIQDDHDYFENDDAYDEIITFPPDAFMTQMARATQSMYYPEFLPDATRPRGLAGSSSDGRVLPVSESFGTLRYGRLAEVLLYTVRRTMTLAGPSAVFLDGEVEGWLTRRMAASDVTHVVNAPSNPPGWTAGKWGEWYPDVLNRDNKLTTEIAKPYWQTGWLKQHDRLMAAMSGMRGRIPLSMSGDLHAIGIGDILRSGTLDLSANPVVTVLTGPVGTSPSGWPSSIRKVGATPPAHLNINERVKPIEQHGFTLADFSPDGITLRFFKWDVNTQSAEALDTLEPFHTAELKPSPSKRLIGCSDAAAFFYSAAMARVEPDALREPEQVCTASSIREARRIEELLTSRGVDYGVQVEEIGRSILFGTPRHGAAFYVAAAQADYCRSVLAEDGHTTSD